MKIKDTEIKKVPNFKYLGSVSKAGDCTEDVKARINAGWNIWRKLTGVTYDKNVPQAEAEAEPYHH